MTDEAPTAEELGVLMPDNWQKPSSLTILPNEPPTLLDIISIAAKRPDVDVGKLRELWELHREYRKDQAKEAFNEAVARFAPLVGKIKQSGVITYKDGKGSFRYARWGDIDDAIREPLAQCGLSLSFTEIVGDGGIRIIGKLRHVGGHSEENSVGPLPLDISGGKTPIQQHLSTISYGKKYCAVLILNLNTSDSEEPEEIAMTISGDQAAELTALLAEVGMQEKQFLALVGAPTVENIPAGSFAFARGILISKRKK